MSNPKITIREVADQAGVSVSTVSKFINRTQHFSPQVEARISAAVDELGYRSNPLARSMITGKTSTIGVVVFDIRNPHFTNIVKGANRLAVQHGLTILLVDTEENQDRELQLLESLAMRVDGMIISSRMGEASLAWATGWGKPLVFFGSSGTRDGAPLPLPSVHSDSHLAAFMLTRHLLDQGFRRIAYLGYSQARWSAVRLQGVHESLAAADGDPPLVFDAGEPSARAGEQSCSAILLRPDPPDAVICYNDLLALGVLKEATALGVDIPGRVGLAGFDNIPFTELCSPPLTTVDLNSEKLGEAAMGMLLSMIAGGPPPADLVLQPRLVVRPSTLRHRPGTQEAKN